MTRERKIRQKDMPLSNYEIAKARTAKLFLTYDLPAMIEKTGLESDAAYIYLNFLGRLHRISLETGLVEYRDEDGLDSIAGNAQVVDRQIFKEADYNAAMTIYDIICYSDPACSASGRYISMQNLAPIYNASRGSSSFAGEGMFGEIERLFDRYPKALEAACRLLGGKPFGKGDVSYRIPIFSYNGSIEVALDFWASDEEFPPKLTLLCDDHLLQYLHYETVWFMVGYLLGRVKELMDSEKD